MSLPLIATIVLAALVFAVVRCILIDRACPNKTDGFPCAECSQRCDNHLRFAVAFLLTLLLLLVIALWKLVP